MADLLALRLDEVTARHLVRALDAHRRSCREYGQRLPDALADLALMARAGQDRTTRAFPSMIGILSGASRLMMDVRQTGAGLQRLA